MWKDRQQAGEALGSIIISQCQQNQFSFGIHGIKLDNPYVLAIPRGGVVVGYYIAKRLHCPLNVIISRKIRHPFNEEFAIGYVTEQNQPVLGYTPQMLHDIPTLQIDEAITNAMKETQDRVLFYRKGEDLPDLSKYDVILVDDGIATFWTLQGTITYLNHNNKPKSITVAVPVVLSQKTYDIVKSKVDNLICPHISDELSIGAVYNNFNQVSDEEVKKLLEEK